MRGGAPLSWTRPLNPNGQYSPDMVGTYAKHYMHWNLEYLAPGLTARYANKNKVGYWQRLGFRVAEPTEARMGAQPYGQPSNQGSGQETRFHVLMVAPIELVNQHHAERAERESGLINRTFAERTQAAEREYERRANRPIRFTEPSHGLRRTNQTET